MPPRFRHPIGCPGGYEGAEMLKRMFARMGLGPRELVALSGAHTLGHTQRKPFTSGTRGCFRTRTTRSSWS